MKIKLVSPRGFCAGVDRAILIVEKALEKYGPPVYVRHEIVHNRHVVEKLSNKGAIFVEELDEVPAGANVIFSAHGVAQTVYEQAKQRELSTIDATCPLVKKVHSSVKRHNLKNKEIILIGHPGHPEVIGTMGQLPENRVKLVSSVENVETLEVTDPDNLAYTTQTTLSMYETKEIMEALRKRFPKISGPDAGDLCYATTNRQRAVLQIAEQVDLLLVIGSKNSSNSNRLRELAQSEGVTSYLIDSYHDIDPTWFAGVESVGISSGASAPEDLVQEVVDWLQKNFSGCEVEEVNYLEENVQFALPAGLD